MHLLKPLKIGFNYLLVGAQSDDTHEHTKELFRSDEKKRKWLLSLWLVQHN